MQLDGLLKVSHGFAAMPLSRELQEQGSHTKNMGQNKTFSTLFQYPTVVYLMPHTHITNHNYKS